MGAFFTNLHARTVDATAFERALTTLGALPAYVSEPEGGWLSAYPELTESQDTDELDRLASALSQHLHCAVFAFLVHDSDIFRYVLFEDGKLRDVYDSAPGYFEGKR